tara:strand:- start:433 stop:696 length:264 start_codon:yes stop_codon:yes gene_type:complete
MSEPDPSCNEPLVKDATTPVTTPVTTPRKRRRFDRSTTPLPEDVAAANLPAFVIECDKPDETHVQHRLLCELLAAREQRIDVAALQG